ncbi:TPA: adenylate/guanylate cyclase domain-containing protein [Candidatus Sumerlaeota bacterium]|nr:adenylate/guanylate cyclase domain-containing protein [Candidatus Sumerlaeota bacterium]
MLPKNKFSQGILIGFCSTLLVLALSAVGALAWLEAPLYKWRVQTFAKPTEATDQIRLVFIDQNSLDWAQRENSETWPWPRAYHAAITDFFTRAGAKAVVFDLLFTKPSRLGVEDDETFAAAIRKTKGFVTAAACSRTQGETTAWPKDLASSVSIQVVPPEPSFLQSLTLPHASFPVSRLTTAGAQFGSTFGDPDPDGVIRRLPALQLFDGHVIPSLGLAAYLAAQPDARLAIGKAGLLVNGRPMPLDGKGNAVLYFRGPSQTHKTVNAAAVIQSELRLRAGQTPALNPADFKDKIILVGVTAAGLNDLKNTPLGSTYPGVELYATLLDNLLTHNNRLSVLREVPMWFVFALALLLATSAAVALRHARHIYSTLLLSLVFLPLPLLLGFGAYTLGGWLNVAVPFSAVALALVGTLAVNYAVEGRKKRFIRGAFRQYLSPAVIEQLVNNPNKLKLGGELRELSIYFSDVQGFTSISENLTPVELTALLNDYLTAMTDIIMEEGGTVDKYEGDAIIAFWNAPLDLPGHAECAVRAAIRCQKKIDELCPIFMERIDNKPFSARIGLNTGKVVVGNMGSNQRFDYTFLGDAGNLASRLEGVNKQFGTRILISEATKEKLGSDFAVREISRIQVVGKEEPIRVFEPMFPADYAAHKKTFDAFATALSLYYNGSFQEAIAIFTTHESADAPSAAYARRCRDLIANPPSDWHGIWKMTEK